MGGTRRSHSYPKLAERCALSGKPDNISEWNNKLRPAALKVKAPNGLIYPDLSRDRTSWLTLSARLLRGAQINVRHSHSAARLREQDLYLWDERDTAHRPTLHFVLFLVDSRSCLEHRVKQRIGLTVWRVRNIGIGI